MQIHFLLDSPPVIECRKSCKRNWGSESTQCSVCSLYMILYCFQAQRGEMFMALLFLSSHALIFNPLITSSQMSPAPVKTSHNLALSLVWLHLKTIKGRPVFFLVMFRSLTLISFHLRKIVIQAGSQPEQAGLFYFISSEAAVRICS